MTGFVAAYRDSLDHPLFKGSADKLGAWMWLLMSAAWKQTKFDVNGKVITVERGQLSVSIRHLAEAWGWSKSTTERFLTRLKTETMIETEAGTGRLLITICNYDKYQNISEKSGTVVGTRVGTAAGQQRDIKEQGNKETRDIEPNGSISQRADALDDIQELPLADDKAAKPKSKGSRKSPPFDEATFELPDDIPAVDWAAFVAMRRETGRKIKTLRGANGLIDQLRQLAEDGHPPGPVLRQSVAYEYQGVFPLKTGRVNNGNGNHHNQQPEQSHGLAEAIAERRSGRASEQPQFL